MGTLAIYLLIGALIVELFVWYWRDNGLPVNRPLVVGMLLAWPVLLGVAALVMLLTKLRRG